MKTKNKPANEIKTNLGLTYEQLTSICRSCLAKERKLFDIKVFETVFKDLTGVIISPSDRLPQVLCYECVVLLQKFVKFRTKVLKSHDILTQYIQDRTLFASDNFRDPLLVQSKVVHSDIPSTDVEQLEVHIDSVKGGIDLGTKKEVVEIKEEYVFSDNEANCEEDPLNELIDREPNDTKHSGAMCNIYQEQPTRHAKVPYLEFDVEIEVTPESQDQKPEDTGVNIFKQEFDIENNTTGSTSEECKKEVESLKVIKSDVTATDEKYKINKSLSNYKNVHLRNTERLNKCVNKDEIETPIGNERYVNIKARDIKSYVCSKCKKCFNNKKYFKVHVHGNASRPYKCDDCCKNFSNKHNLFKHSLAHIAKPYQCDVCPKSYKHKPSLITHINEHFNCKIYMCDICGKAYNSVGAFQQHIRKHAAEIEMKCDVCDACFTTEAELKRHIGQHTGERPFKCHLCIKCYPRNTELEKHIRTKHIDIPSINTEKPYLCNICNKRYTHEISLKNHIRNHNRPYQCDVCSLGYCNKKSLIDHLSIHFSKKLHKCVVCNRSYRSTRHLRDHMYKHSDYKLYKCNECDGRFSRTNELNRHVREHHMEDKPYKCDVCMKKFQIYSQLQRHSMVHTGLKPFKCEVCKRCFFSKQYLEIHMRKHTGEKPFKCEVCMKTFAAKKYLALHLRKHTGEKPYKCEICARSFSQRSSLRTHYRVHDKTDKVDQVSEREKADQSCRSFEY